MASPHNVSPEKSKHGNRTPPDLYHWIEKLEKEFRVEQFDPDDPDRETFTSRRPRWAWDGRLGDLLYWAYGFAQVGMCPNLALRMLVNDFIGPGRLEPVEERSFTYYEQLEELEAQLGIDKEAFVKWRIRTVHWEICRLNRWHILPNFPLALLLNQAANMFGNWRSDLKFFTDTMEETPFHGTAIESLTYFEQRYGIVVTEPEDEDDRLTFCERLRAVELKADIGIDYHDFKFFPCPLLTRFKWLHHFALVKEREREQTQTG